MAPSAHNAITAAPQCWRVARERLLPFVCVLTVSDFTRSSLFYVVLHFRAPRGACACCTAGAIVCRRTAVSRHCARITRHFTHWSSH